MTLLYLFKELIVVAKYWKILSTFIHIYKAQE